MLVNDNINLSPFQEGDIDQLVALLQEEEIYRNLLRLPRPYLRKNAEEWIARQPELFKEYGTQSHYAIRNRDGLCIGSIGRHFVDGADSHKDEIGYWLGKPFWGQGIMSDVVRFLTDYYFAQGKLKRITATIFDYNPASVRVVEKAGFQREGYLRKCYLKDGAYIDAVLYARIYEE